MLAILIGLIGAYLVMREVWHDSDGLGEKLGVSFLGLLFGFVFTVMASLLISLAALLFIPTETKVTGQRNIVAVKDKSETQGSFFLGSGTIDGELVYYAIVQTDNGLQTQQFGIRETKLFEGDYKPHIKTVNKQFKGNACMLLGCMNMDNSEYHFYIPANSIDRSFKVDLDG